MAATLMILPWCARYPPCLIFTNRFGNICCSKRLTFNTPIAKIIFFDTYKDIGVMTEIMGITKEGEEQVQKMKN
jgi:hypothetical protein